MSRSDRETEQKNGYGDRLKEITAVLKKHSDRKSTRLNSSHGDESRMPSSA